MQEHYIINVDGKHLH